MKYSFTDTRKIGRDNPAASWGKNDKGNEWSVPCRMNQKFLDIHLPQIAKRIPRASKFFAIGSCFARGIENALIGQGMDVASFDSAMQKWKTANPAVTAQGAMNKYNTHSILKEIEWSRDFSNFPHAEMVADINDEESFDLSLNQTLKLVGRDETIERHRYISEQVFSNIWTADVVFITLGLTEVWIDELTGLALNGAPNPILLKRQPERFSVKMMSMPEIRKDLEKIIKLLGQSPVNKSLFLTVSPVPLMRTFTENDVVIANMTSKSRLKAVVSEIVEDFESVNYFPSYEIVINSDREFAWESDRRHVRGEMTQFIMRTFIEKYIEV